jgi:hypothetical protein
MRARSILTLTLLLFGLTGSSLLFNGCSQPADEKKAARRAKKQPINLFMRRLHRSRREN